MVSDMDSVGYKKAELLTRVIHLKDELNMTSDEFTYAIKEISDIFVNRKLQDDSE